MKKKINYKNIKITKKNGKLINKEERENNYKDDWKIYNTKELDELVRYFIYWKIDFNKLWILDTYSRLNKKWRNLKPILKNLILINELSKANYLRYKIIYSYFEDLKIPELNILNKNIRWIYERNTFINPNYKSSSHIIYNKNW